MYTLINGSPKTHKSNSRYFLEYISKYLKDYSIYDLKKNKYSDIIDSIIKSDTIVLAFPLYVDSPNSMTLSFLNYIIEKQIKINDKNIYIIINCGFKEGEQNITAINIIKNWCTKTKINYQGSLMIGAGEIVGKDHYKLICRKARKQLKKISLNIKNKKSTDDVITTMDLLNISMYCKLANRSWKKKIKFYKKMHY